MNTGTVCCLCWSVVVVVVAASACAADLNMLWSALLAPPPTIPRARSPILFTGDSGLGDSGLGDHDIYGFEPTHLPALPSGEKLVVHLGDGREWDEPSAPVDESAEMWKRIEQYVSNFDEGDEDDDDYAGIGGEIWPAAVAMCDWLANNTIAGTRVLELGSGTGACGLYAAGLGASHVLLTDGGSLALHELCAGNIEANRRLFADDARVQAAQLRWGAEADGGSPEASFAAALAELHGERGTEIGEGRCVGDLADTEPVFDWVIASDVTYGHEAFGSESRIIGALCHTLGSLLRSGGRRASGCHAATTTSAQGPAPSHRPRVIMAHEHRARDCGLPWLRDDLKNWDEADEHLESLKAAALAEGLVLRPLWSKRPECVQRNEFRSWTADLSVFEVLLSSE